MDRAVLEQHSPSDPLRFTPVSDTPLVSVLVTNYNYAEYIGEAIHSVQAQSYSHWELIVCDDGSSDGSRDVIEKRSAADSRILLVSQENSGQAAALNRAFGHANGAVICLLDADDAFAPTKLQRVVETFKAVPDAGMVTHHLQVVDGQSRPRRVAHVTWQGFLGPDIPTLRMGLPIPQASGLSFRREVLTEILPLPQDAFRSVADWAVGYAAACITATAVVPAALARYRVHDRNLSGTTSTATRLEAAQIEKTLNGIERVLHFVDSFVRQRTQPGLDTRCVRNLLEHRLMLGILRAERRMISAAVDDLRSAWQRVRRDYPVSRYRFWRTLAFLPPALSRPLLLLAFQAFRLARRVQRAGPAAEPPSGTCGTLAYAVSVFPCLTETFVAREIEALKRRGFDVIVIALRRPAIQPGETLSARDTLASCEYARPDKTFRHVLLNLWAMLLHPVRYFSTLGVFVREGTKTEPRAVVSLLYHFACGVGFSFLIRQRRITHLHCHFAAASNVALAAHLFSGVTFSFTAHASGDVFVKPVLLPTKVREARMIVAVCDYTRQYLDSITDFEQSRKLHRIYNGVALEEWTRLTVQSGDRTPDGPGSPATLRLLSVGSLVSAKGHTTLIEVCRLLRQQKCPVECTIVGDGPQREILARRIRDALLADTVFLTGPLPLGDVYRLMRTADVFVLLSEIGVNGYRDGFPTVILEAMAMSLPVVSTLVSGIPEIVEDHSTGLLVQERNPTAAAAAIRRLQQDPALRATMGAAGRERVRRLYDLDQSVDRLAELLAEAVAVGPVQHRQVIGGRLSAFCRW
jgi:glycosyltransferase involved in cell wall biosynthesis/GT2 family glycosyltransferase